jgi:hypothetical protein
MHIATTVSAAQREPQLLGRTIVVVGDSAGTPRDGPRAARPTPAAV